MPPPSQVNQYASSYLQVPNAYQNVPQSMGSYNGSATESVYSNDGSSPLAGEYASEAVVASGSVTPYMDGISLSHREAMLELLALSLQVIFYKAFGFLESAVGASVQLDKPEIVEAIDGISELVLFFKALPMDTEPVPDAGVVDLRLTEAFSSLVANPRLLNSYPILLDLQSPFSNLAVLDLALMAGLTEFPRWIASYNSLLASMNISPSAAATPLIALSNSTPMATPGAETPELSASDGGIHGSGNRNSSGNFNPTQSHSMATLMNSNNINFSTNSTASSTTDPAALAASTATPIVAQSVIDLFSPGAGGQTPYSEPASTSAADMFPWLPEEEDAFDNDELKKEDKHYVPELLEEESVLEILRDSWEYNEATQAARDAVVPSMERFIQEKQLLEKEQVERLEEQRALKRQQELELQRQIELEAAMYKDDDDDGDPYGDIKASRAAATSHALQHLAGTTNPYPPPPPQQQQQQPPSVHHVHFQQQLQPQQHLFQTAVAQRSSANQMVPVAVPVNAPASALPPYEQAKQAKQSQQQQQLMQQQHMQHQHVQHQHVLVPGGAAPAAAATLSVPATGLARVPSPFSPARTPFEQAQTPQQAHTLAQAQIKAEVIEHQEAFGQAVMPVAPGAAGGQLFRIPPPPRRGEEPKDRLVWLVPAVQHGENLALQQRQIQEMNLARAAPSAHTHLAVAAPSAALGVPVPTAASFTAPSPSLSAAASVTAAAAAPMAALPTISPALASVKPAVKLEPSDGALDVLDDHTPVDADAESRRLSRLISPPNARSSILSKVFAVLAIILLISFVYTMVFVFLKYSKKMKTPSSSPKPDHSSPPPPNGSEEKPLKDVETAILLLCPWLDLPISYYIISRNMEPNSSKWKIWKRTVLLALAFFFFQILAITH